MLGTLWKAWLPFYHIPLIFAVRTKKIIVSQLEECIWFTIWRHSLGAILVLEIYSICLVIWLDHVKESSNYEKMILFLAGRWLRSCISSLAVGIYTIWVQWASSYFPACPGFSEVRGTAVISAELNVKHNAKSYLLIYIIFLLFHHNTQNQGKLKQNFAVKLSLFAYTVDTQAVITRKKQVNLSN